MLEGGMCSVGNISEEGEKGLWGGVGWVVSGGPEEQRPTGQRLWKKGCPYIEWWGKGPGVGVLRSGRG